MANLDPNSVAADLDRGMASAGPMVDALLDGGGRSLRLWAPSFVALDRRSPPRVTVGAAGAPGELLRLGLERRALVVAVDVERGSSRVVAASGSLVAGVPGEATRLPPAPGYEGGLDPSAVGRAAQVVGFPLWTGEASHWPTGAYALFALAGDRVSERTVVKVGHAPSTVDPALEPVEPESLRVWPPPDPAGGMPHYHELEQSPPVPGAPGIALVADRVARAGRALVHGSFRVRLHKRWIAAHGAVVPLTLVLTGSEDPRPVVVGLRLPSFDPADPASPPATVAGHFALDLLGLAPLAASPQTWFLHAFTGDASAGPLPIAVPARPV